MQRQIAFLRGINLGKRRVKGPELATIFVEAGLDNPATFLASGNVIFDAPPIKNLGRRIEKALESSLGYNVPTILRSAKEVRDIAAHQPFTEEALATSTGKVQVTLLMKSPTKDAADQVLALASDEDRLAFHGQQLYWLPAAGLSDSDLDFKAIESTLGVITTRTQNTIQRLTTKFLT